MPVPPGDGRAAVRRGLLSALAPVPPAVGRMDVSRVPTVSLAYIGDVVYELSLRSKHLWPVRRTQEYRDLVVKDVRAETQSYLLRRLLSEQEDVGVGRSLLLTKTECEVLRRGRNSVNGKGPKRFGGGAGGSPEIYADATALEALIGYAYLQGAGTDSAGGSGAIGEDRCAEILDWVRSALDSRDA